MLAGPSSKGRLAIPVESIVDVDARRSLLRHRLVILTSDGGQYLVGSLQRDGTVQLDRDIREVAARGVRPCDQAGLSGGRIVRLHSLHPTLRGRLASSPTSPGDLPAVVFSSRRAWPPTYWRS